MTTFHPSIGVIVSVALAACSPDHKDVECTEDAICNLHPGGSCDTYAPTGSEWCSYADEACNSGRRWSKLAGDDLANACVVAGSVADAGVDGMSALTDASVPHDANADGGAAVVAANDINGDGFADLVVGAPTNDAGGKDAGRVYVYFGGPGRFDSTPNGILTGARVEARFGTAVAIVGDVNGDGFADVVVGAPQVTDASAFVYYGGPGTTFDPTPDGTLAGVGTDDFGIALASGDVNGDGFTDIVVGAPEDDTASTFAGRAYVFLGGPADDFDVVADGVLTSTNSGGERLGTAVAAGDVNGDGFADVLVGAPNSNTVTTFAGSAYVYFGGPGGAFDDSADVVLDGTIFFGAFGSSVASAGDLNGDGFGDLVIGETEPGIGAGSAGPGAAYVYFGGAGELDGVADGTLLGGVVLDGFGGAASSAGDVNGDGYDDVIIGASKNDAGGNEAGRAYVYFGAPGSAFDDAPYGVITGAAAGDDLGASVASVDDLNGDGFADIVVGAPGNDAGGSAAGAAYIYLGGPGATFNAVSDATLTGAGTGDAFGTSVD